MAKQKIFKPVPFKAKIDGKEVKLEIVIPKVIVPGFGTLTAEGLLKNEAALAHVVKKSFGTIVKEASSKKVVSEDGEETKEGGK